MELARDEGDDRGAGEVGGDSAASAARFLNANDHLILRFCSSLQYRCVHLLLLSRRGIPNELRQWSRSDGFLSEDGHNSSFLRHLAYRLVLADRTFPVRSSQFARFRPGTP